MTSRELVYQTLSFNDPERVPRQLWLLPWASKNHPNMCDKLKQDFKPDIIHADVLYENPPVRIGDPYEIGEYIDEWGCIFENKQYGIIGEVKKPIVIGEDWEDFDNVHIPTELLTFDIDAINDFCAKTNKFVLTPVHPRPFEQLQFMRGTEEFFMDLATGNTGLDKAINKVHEFNCKLLSRWAKTDVDALFIMDDWGAQRSLLINPKTWVAIFKPLYKDYIDIAHKHGKKIFMHSDGYILDIIDHLIELGLDALNSQIFCIGVENLEKYAGKITFWGEVDRQWLLPYAKNDEIIDAVKKVYKTLWRNGGCIAQCEFGIGANPENVFTIFETWDSFHK